MNPSIQLNDHATGNPITLQYADVQSIHYADNGAVVIVNVTLKGRAGKRMNVVTHHDAERIKQWMLDNGAIHTRIGGSEPTTPAIANIDTMMRSWCATYLGMPDDVAAAAAKELRVMLRAVANELYDFRDDAKFYRGPLAEPRADVPDLGIVRFADLRVAPDDGLPWNGVERRKEPR